MVLEALSKRGRRVTKRGRVSKDTEFEDVFVFQGPWGGIFI